MGKESKPREYGLLSLSIQDPASSTSLGNLRILISQGTQDSFMLPWTHQCSLESITIAVSEFPTVCEEHLLGRQ